MYLVFLGPPGSGKGTQARRLSEQLPVTIVSSGDIFREEMSRKTALGQQLESYVHAGALVPDELTCEIIFKKLGSIPETRGFLLDGFPRNLAQAYRLEDFMKTRSIRLDAVFYLDVDEASIIERLSTRRQCKDCQSVYNLVDNPPRLEGVCDGCGGRLAIREDDKPQTIHRRLIVSKDLTASLVQYYEHLKILIRIDGSKSVDEVAREILDSLRLCQH